MALIEKRPPWFDELRHTLEGNWRHHGPCGLFNMTSFYDDQTGNWLIVAAPVFQEVFGGEKDGLKVWTGFAFDISGMEGLFGMTGLAIHGIEARSRCVDCSPVPSIEMRCKYQGERVTLQILLEPLPDSPVSEVIDTINLTLREPTRTGGPEDHLA